MGLPQYSCNSILCSYRVMTVLHYNYAFLVDLLMEWEEHILVTSSPVYTWEVWLLMKFNNIWEKLDVVWLRRLWRFRRLVQSLYNTLLYRRDHFLRRMLHNFMSLQASLHCLKTFLFLMTKLSLLLWPLDLLKGHGSRSYFMEFLILL